MADVAAQLAAIEQQISAERLAYLHAYWAGRYSECVEHDETIDRLLNEWRAVRDATTKEPA